MAMTSSEEYGSSYAAAGDVPTTGAYSSGEYVAPTSGYGTHSQDDQTRGGVKETAGVAKDQAAGVAGGAADAAQHVAGVAKEQAGQVTAEAGRQVKHLLGQARGEVSDQAQTQQQRAASGLHSVGDQLKAMASGEAPQSGMVTDLAHQAAEKAHDIASWLENRDPAAILDEARTFAKQRPGAFLAIALGAGILAGRLARGMATDPAEVGKDSSDGRPQGAYDQTPGTYAIPRTGYETGQPYGTAPQPVGYGAPATGYGAPAGDAAYGYTGQPGVPGVPGYAAGQPYGSATGSDWTGQSAGQRGEDR